MFCMALPAILKCKKEYCHSMMPCHSVSGVKWHPQSSSIQAEGLQDACLVQKKTDCSVFPGISKFWYTSWSPEAL